MLANSFNLGGVAGPLVSHIEELHSIFLPHCKVLSYSTNNNNFLKENCHVSYSQWSNHVQSNMEISFGTQSVEPFGIRLKFLTFNSPKTHVLDENCRWERCCILMEVNIEPRASSDNKNEVHLAIPKPTFGGSAFNLIISFPWFTTTSFDKVLSFSNVSCM